MQITPHAKTVNALLESKGDTLAGFLGERRSEGMSYRKIAQALHEATDGVVDVTGETIRNWISDTEKVSA